MPFLSQEISQNTYIHIMDQYDPAGKASHTQLMCPVTSREITEARFLAQATGLRRIHEE